MSLNKEESKTCLGCARMFRDVRVEVLRKEHNNEVAEILQKKGGGDAVKKQKKIYPKRHPTLTWYCKECPSRALTIVPTRENSNGNGVNGGSSGNRGNGGGAKQSQGIKRVTCIRCHRRPKADKNAVCRQCAAHAFNGDPHVDVVTGKCTGCQINGCELCEKYWKRQSRLKRNEELISQGDPYEVYDVSPPEEIKPEIEALLNSMGPENAIRYMKDRREFDYLQAWIGEHGEFLVYNNLSQQHTEFFYTPVV